MISPSVGEANESGHTLRYAYKTKHIKNKAKVNVENDKSLIKSFESAIYKLQSQLSDIDTRNAKTMEKAVITLNNLYNYFYKLNKIVEKI